MKQPKAIMPIFFAEMWERFGYYAIQGLLVLYLVYHLNFTAAHAFITMSEFLSWVYVAPVIGGLVADHMLGYRYSILTGACLLAIGYLLLAFYGSYFLHMSLALIIVGNGLLKPNSASFLGKFYYHEDPRRYSGFTFFFIGINIGGLLSILVTSIVINYIGYQTAFAVAGIGLIIAACAFVAGFRNFENRGLPVRRTSIESPLLRILNNRSVLFFLLLTLVQIVHFLLLTSQISEIALFTVAFCVLLSLFYIQSRYNQTTRNRLIATILLTGSSIVFWAMQLQIFFSIILFTEEKVQRNLLGHTLPAPFFIILEPLFLLVLGPVLATILKKLSIQGLDPTPATKFSTGLLITGFAMTVLAFANHVTPSNQLINPSWLILFYALLTTSGLLITPTGLAMITELVPPKLTGFMMGTWYMVIGLGGLLAGKLARQTLSHGQILTRAPSQSDYAHAFFLYATISLSVGLLLLLAGPHLKKLMKM